MTFAALFPGQGSQAVGMLSDLAASCPQVGETFTEASEALGYDLWSLVQQGPDKRLQETERTQPAMLAAGVAVWRCWSANQGADPEIAAGHSLGEYSALAAFGAIDFSDAVRIVAARGRFMQEAVPEGEGGIAAVLGLKDEEVVSLCAEVCDDSDPGQVFAVNFNAPRQVAIAGDIEALERAMESMRCAGAKKIVRLPMSVPVHCPLMAPAAQRLEGLLAAIDLRPPRLSVLHNADLLSHRKGGEIRTALVDQLTLPVQWSRCIASMGERGVKTAIEFGPGRVLAGLARRIDRDLQVLAVHDTPSLEQALQTIQSRG
ncbi:ACP S-malonyltransferase [Thioalkalivibrio sp. HK1]|uniref:ACP S-malonyltransferase n=1 Tax=Thioalkalivibrio sp. HK1 TaxID=1469245 RepID=UPI00047142FE|nr:ACP S-malonyltransferase [Thioalkalivibrio sp. HK1]